MRLRFALPLLPVALGACVQSANPLYTDATLVSVPDLVGTWVGSGDVLVVTAPDSLTYRLAMMDEQGESSLWIGHVTSLGGRNWLDVVPDELPDDWGDAYRASFMPLHQFWALRRVDSILLGAAIVYDSLKAALERDPSTVVHAEVGDGFVLTAGTTALRAFVETTARRPGWLKDGDPMRRVPRSR
jgi:hypothetical protein